MRDEPHSITCRCPACDPQMRAERRKTRRLALIIAAIVIGSWAWAALVIFHASS